MQTVEPTASAASAMSAATHLETQLRRALDLGEASMRFLALEELLHDVERFRSTVIDLRDIAAYEANLAGWSYGKLGAEIGKSKALGQQMVNHGRELVEEDGVDE